MLAMQLGIVCVVLVGVAAVSLAQSDARARDTEGRRALAIAERLAVTAGVREAAASGGEDFLGQAQSVVESGRTFSSSTTVLLALRDRRVIASSDALPRAPLYLQATDAFDGRSWVGTEQGTGAALAMAPIINVDNRETDGVVAVVRAYPSVLDNLETALPNLLTYLGIASLLGVRRVAAAGPSGQAADARTRAARDRRSGRAARGTAARHQGGCAGRRPRPPDHHGQRRSGAPARHTPHLWRADALRRWTRPGVLPRSSPRRWSSPTTSCRSADGC